MGIFGFAVLANFRFVFLVFCVKKLWFFNFLHFGLRILCDLAFDFWFLSKMEMDFWNFLRSEQQLSTSTDLK